MVVDLLDKFFNDPTPGHEKARLIILMVVVYGGIVVGLIASCIHMKDTKQSSTLSREQRAEMEAHRKKSVQLGRQKEFDCEREQKLALLKRQQRIQSQTSVSEIQDTKFLLKISKLIFMCTSKFFKNLVFD